MPVSGSSHVYRYGGKLAQDVMNLLSRNQRSGAPSKTPAGLESRRLQEGLKTADARLKSEGSGRSNASGLGNRVDTKA